MPSLRGSCTCTGDGIDCSLIGCGLKCVKKVHLKRRRNSGKECNPCKTLLRTKKKSAIQRESCFVLQLLLDQVGILLTVWSREKVESTTFGDSTQVVVKELISTYYFPSYLSHVGRLRHSNNSSLHFVIWHIRYPFISFRFLNFFLCMRFLSVDWVMFL